MSTTLEWTDQDSRTLTVALVACDGHRMRLRKAERHDAVRAMLDRDVPVDAMAERLHLSVASLRRDAKRHGIELPDTHPVQDWWVAYVERCRAKEHERERMRRHRAKMREATG